MPTYLECLEELVQATEQIKTATAAADWDQVLAGLAERQAVMDRIDALPAGVRAMDAADRSRAIALLDHVAGADGLVAQSLSEAMAATREAIYQHRRTQQSILAYRRLSRTQLPGAEARFVDTQR